MKRIQSVLHLVLILILSLSFACDHKFRNPLDPDTEIKTDEWAPDNLTVTVIDDSHVRLIWTQEDSRIEGFVIERKDGNANYKEVGRTDTTVFVDDSLKVGINYVYKILAYAEKNLSNPVTSQIISTSFPAPTGLNATVINDQTIRLTWTDNCSFESGFRIERKTGTGSYTQISEVNANTTNYEDDSLTYGETYTYRVRAYTPINQSGYSNEKSVTTTFPAPSNLNIEAIDDQSVRLTWTDNCSFEAGYKIERKTGTGSFVQIAEVNANSTSYEETGLTYGETYTYRIRAYTQINQSGYSNENSAQMTIQAPSNLTTTAIDDQTIRLNWTDNCSFESGYRIERKTGSGSFVQITEVNANSTEYEETGLTYGETYTYRIRAYTQINQSAYSNENSAHMVIPAPSNLTTTAIDDQSIRLNWTDNCSFESGYRIERKTGTGSFVQIAELSANATGYEETGLTYGETYNYRVRAYTQINQSDYSNEKSAQMIIHAPTIISATAIDDQTIRLTWTDNCLFEAGFRIERKTGTESFVQIAEVNANSTEYEETGLTYDETYTYRICAFTDLNNSEYSNEKTARWTVTDIDGNKYQTVKIGNQLWMAENLKVTHYRNGDAIPNITDGSQWHGLTTGAYCNYDNDVNNATTYGRLYNWYAVNDSRNITPIGWHVPSDAEWQTLVDYLGGESVAGGKMKEAGITHWSSPNSGATNESGFSALPGGYRGIHGSCSSIGYSGYWWSATEYNSYYAWDRYLYGDGSDVGRSGYEKQGGFSVRCVGD